MTPSNTTTGRKLERILAILGAAICLVISVGLWQAIRVDQPMWPFPDLFLFEIAAVSCLCTGSIWSNGRRLVSRHGILAWATIEVILGFMILGAFSIGFAHIPTASLLASAAILSSFRQRQNLIMLPGVCLAVALAQAVFMLAVIQITQGQLHFDSVVQSEGK